MGRRRSDEPRVVVSLGRSSTTTSHIVPSIIDMGRRRSSPSSLVLGLLLSLVVASYASSDEGSEAVVRSTFKGDTLLGTVEKVSKTQGSDTTIAPLLYIAGPDPEAYELVASLFDVGEYDQGHKTQVRTRMKGSAAQ